MKWWIWVIIAVIIILLLIGWYMSTRRKSAEGRLGEGAEPAGRVGDGGHGTSGGGAVVGTTAAAGGVGAAAAGHHEEEQQAAQDEAPREATPEVTDTVATTDQQTAEAHAADEPAPANEPQGEQPADVADAAAAHGDQQPEAAGAAAAHGDQQPEAAGAAAAADARADRPVSEPPATDAGTTAVTEPDTAGAAGAVEPAAHHHHRTMDEVHPVAAPPEPTEHIGEAAPQPGEPPAIGHAETTSPGAGQVGAAQAAAPAASDAGPIQHENVPAGAAVPPATGEGTEADPMVQRFGPGAASPQPDGSAPAGYSIKGNADSMLFHTPDSPRYAATQPQVWFKDEDSARGAGFAHWDRTRRGAPVAPPAAAPSESEAAASPEAPPAPASASPTETSAPAPAPTPTPTPTEAPSTGAQPAGEAAPSAPTGEPDPVREQFGDGAASPRPDGSAPSAEFTIKGNADSMTFHTPDSPAYQSTEAEAWFKDEATARNAGFMHWDPAKR